MSETPHSEQPEETKQEYNFEVMKEVEPAMISLIEQLKDGIESGEYSALIGDDVKGRIPTLVLQKVFQEKGLNQDNSEERVKIYFLAGGRDVITRPKNLEKIKDYFKKLDFGSKGILLVTEFIEFGDTIKFFSKALQGIGIERKRLACASLDTSLFKDMEKDIGIKCFFGRTEGEPAHSTELKEMSGVKKNEPSFLSKTHKNFKEVEKAREDVDLMADRIIEQVWGKNNFENKF
ncbi:MAG: hypothetical protein Q8Q48_01435 [Candidatus Staskawiczbacteria bacterium]|nr:hypothetical protein [Candidatus Staskawiczbacteria bacterium]